MTQLESTTIVQRGILRELKGKYPGIYYSKLHNSILDSLFAYWENRNRRKQNGLR